MLLLEVVLLVVFVLPLAWHVRRDLRAHRRREVERRRFLRDQSIREMERDLALPE